MLAVDDDRRLDPEDPPNARYLALHRVGLDHRGHAVHSEAIVASGEPAGPPEPEAPAAAPELFSDWAAQAVDIAAADRLLAIVDCADAAPLLCAMLECLRASVAGELTALGNRLDALDAEIAAIKFHSARMIEAVASLLDIEL